MMHFQLVMIALFYYQFLLFKIIFTKAFTVFKFFVCDFYDDAS